jgi:Domain of unknown function (DUF397)
MTITHIIWHKSSYSNGWGGACVEVADLDGDRAVRDSTNPAGPALRFPAAAWSAFTAGVRAGEFD